MHCVNCFSIWPILIRRSSIIEHHNLLNSSTLSQKSPHTPPRSSLLLSAALLAFWGSNGRSARGGHSSIWLFALTIDTFTDDEDDPGLLLQRLLQQQQKQRQAASICLACPGGSLVESGFFSSRFFVAHDDAHLPHISVALIARRHVRSLRQFLSGCSTLLLFSIYASQLAWLRVSSAYLD